MKKILLVIDNLGSGGAQNQITLLASELVKEGYNVGLFAYYPNNFFLNRLIKSDVKYYFYQKSDKLGLNIILELYQVIKKNQYETIISFLDTPNFYSSIIKVLFGKKIKLIISYRSMTNFSKLSYFKKSTLKWTNSKADFIISNSHHERERWQIYQKKYAYKWVTIYNGIENMEFFLDRTRKNRLICIGSVSQYKNGICIIEAMNYLKIKGELNFTLHWIGRRNAGITNSTKYVSNMDSLIKSYDLEKHWVWLGQIENVFDEYINADALIHASLVEGLPNVVCEAQMTGCPVILSEVLDHSKLIIDGYNGLLFDPNDPKDLSEKILSFYKLDESRYKDLCQNSRDFALREYIVGIMAKKYIHVINQ